MDRIKNYKLSPFQLSQVTKIERFQGAFEATNFKRPALVESLKKTTIVTSSGASTRIEGAILTDAQVQELYEKNCQINKMSSRSEREVAGYIKGLSYVYENYDHLEVNERTIREIHAILTSDLIEDQLPKKQRGTYKDVTNDVVERNYDTGETKVWFKTTPPGPETETAMRKLIDDYNSVSRDELCHPLIIIGAFVVHFLAIHPFRDGNGRLSRILTSLLLLKHGYRWAQYASHEKVIEDNKEGYYLSLRETQSSLKMNNPNYTPWIDFFTKVMNSQIEFLKGKIQQDSPTTVMNKNENQVYEILKSSGECSVSFLLEQTDLSRPGLKSLLARLVESGIIRRSGQGKATRYHL